MGRQSRLVEHQAFIEVVEEIGDRLVDMDAKLDYLINNFTGRTDAAGAEADSL